MISFNIYVKYNKHCAKNLCVFLDDVITFGFLFIDSRFVNWKMIKYESREIFRGGSTRHDALSLDDIRLDWRNLYILSCLQFFSHSTHLCNLQMARCQNTSDRIRNSVRKTCIKEPFPVNAFLALVVAWNSPVFSY